MPRDPLMPRNHGPVAGAIAAAGIAGVRVYQWTLRGVIGANCRFAPSCSDYAIEALRTHGPARGAWLAGGRILRCNPWCAGGYDPVPPRGAAHGSDDSARHSAGGLSCRRVGH